METERSGVPAYVRMVKEAEQSFMCEKHRNDRSDGGIRISFRNRKGIRAGFSHRFFRCDRLLFRNTEPKAE